MLALDVVVGLVGEAVAPPAALRHELGAALQAGVEGLVGMRLLVVHLPGEKTLQV